MDLVKTHNDFNKISLKNFTEKELNFFLTMLFKARDQKSDLIQINFKELKELSVYKSTSADRLDNDLQSCLKKIKRLSMIIETEEKYRDINLFRYYEIDKTNGNVVFRIEEEFQYLLNDLIGNYTKFDLLEFAKLKSTYSKLLFKHLKQWETTRNFKISMDNFKIYFDVPESYRMTNINDKILKVVLEELKPLFHNLKLKKHKKGTVISSLEFTWSEKPEEKAIKKAKKLFEIAPEGWEEIEKYLRIQYKGLDLEKIQKAIKKYDISLNDLKANKSKWKNFKTVQELEFDIIKNTLKRATYEEQKIFKEE